MAEEEKKKIRLETVLFAGFVTTLFLSFILIVVASIGNETVYSAYVTDANSEELQYQQLNLMADNLDSRTHVTPIEGYQVYNTMSTPMLVNDWREPHRTLLMIVAPEKPIDQIEAEAIYDFVTQKGGKVIVASNGSNAQIVAEQFGVKYQIADHGLIDDRNYYSVQNLETEELYPDNQRNITGHWRSDDSGWNEELISGVQIENRGNLSSVNWVILSPDIEWENPPENWNLVSTGSVDFLNGGGEWEMWSTEDEIIPY